MLRRFTGWSAITVLVIAAAAVLAGSAFAASGASNTTDDPINGHFCLHGPNSNNNPADQPAVNCNAYALKTDVYINGGPTNGNSQLSDGYWLFAVLNPGGQNDPNDGAADNLSDAANGGGGDVASNRVYHVTNGQIDSYGGTHAHDNTYAATDGLLIGLAPFDDTGNPGGVYIEASCFLGSSSTVHTVSPSDCKYDAFRVIGPNTPPGGVDLTGLKTAAGSFTRTFTWSTTKSATPTYVQTSNTTVPANYVVTFTKSAGVDSGWTVSGQVQVFNTNDSAATGVTVTDAIGTNACTVTGGSTTIAANDSATFNYSCSVADTSSGTNVATIGWDKTSINSPTNSATATANFSFGDPTLVGNCTTVSDTRSSLVTGTICATTQFSYSLTLNSPASGCADFPNTASETTSGTSDSATVRVCRTNSNGFTIGYWQNKNGQAYIAAHATALCTYLKTYPIILTGLPTDCSGANIAKDYSKAGSLDKYVYDVIKAANSAGDGVLMLKAQFMATAINVFQTASLGTTNIVLDSTEQSALGLGACASVNSVLTATNSTFTTWSGTKSTVTNIQSMYNDVNNNNRLTC